MTDRLTKFNPETNQYEYRERAKTQEEFNAQRKAVIQRLGEFEDRAEGEWIVEAYKGDEIVHIPYEEHQHDEPFCSRCGKYALLDGKEDYVASNFCPNCGAKMDGERSTKDAT